MRGNIDDGDKRVKRRRRFDETCRYPVFVAVRRASLEKKKPEPAIKCDGRNL